MGMQTLGRRIGRKKEAASRQIEETGWHASRLCTQTDAATIATRMGRDPRPVSIAERVGLGRAAQLPRDRAWPDRREGAAQLLHVEESKSTRYEQRPMPGARFFARSDGPPQGWASSRRCLRGYPRGASPVMKIGARDDRYEVNLPVVPAGTPSACAEARNSDQAGAASAAFHSNSVPSRQMA